MRHFGKSSDLWPLWKPSTWRRRPLALVVDDDPDIRELLQVALGTFFRCQVEMADSAAAAIDMLERRSFSFVVCDLLLEKGSSGMDVFYFLRRSSEGNTPFVLFSANSSSLLPFERDQITTVDKTDLNLLLDVIEGLGFPAV